METIYINDMDVREFGAKALRDYTIGATELTHENYQGHNRAWFVNLENLYGMKSVEFTLFFDGRTRREMMLKKSALDGQLFGLVELFMPDGFYYRCTCTSLGDIEPLGLEGSRIIGTAKYTFSGIQHDQLKILNGSGFYCESTVPYTDCSLSVTVTTAAASYRLGGAVFSNVKAGEKLEFDGIHKRVLRDGAPYSNDSVTWQEFPYLTPGYNQITAVDPVTVSYYPIYM